MNMPKWFMGRVKEPSTYAAIAIAVSGVGIMVDQPYVIVGSIVVAVLAFILKEKGVY
tara:strand:- start:68 stop:238 length:171 start_codon:yes stop_codon:yes gene_type:complete